MIDLSGADLRLNAVREINSLNLPVFLYGVGVYARVLAEFLQEHGIKGNLSYVIDDEYYSQQTNVIPFSEYLKNYCKDSVLVFGFYNYQIIKARIEQYRNIIKHFYTFHFTSLGGRRLKWSQHTAQAHLAEYNQTCSLLRDEYSRLTMRLYLRAAVNGEFDDLYENCHEDIPYFNNVTEKLKIDELIDCGAYDGDSIHDFVKVFPAYNKIYALEPDQNNIEKLKRRINTEHLENIEIIPFGVYREKTSLFFSNDGTSSSHLENNIYAGGGKIDLIKLDDFVSEKIISENLFIKMDIEGSELDALHGAQETIKKIHPALAVCVYHKEQDLIEIPQYIHSLVGEGVYNYYLRFHGLDLAELVFYALPNYKV